MTLAATCKICGTIAGHFGALDLSVNSFDIPIPPAGLRVDYYRCGSCGFLFSPTMDHWTDQEFRSRIYTDDYHIFDPGFAEIRPRNSAQLIDRLFGAHKQNLRIVDYGGGNSATIRFLRERGFANVKCFDPFLSEPGPDVTNRLDEVGRPNLVFCCEVIEHVVDPHSTFAEMASMLDEEGLIFLTTSIQPADILTRRFGWRYIGPRNGHISLFSRESLMHLVQRQGMKLAWFNDEQHVAFRKQPAFAQHIFGPR